MFLSIKEKKTQSRAPRGPDCYFLNGTQFNYSPLSANFRKRQFALRHTIYSLFRFQHKISNVLFITATFDEDLRSVKKAHGRLNSLLNQIRNHYPHGYIWVLEPQESGRIHFHILIPVDFDTHRGTNLDAWQFRKDFTDADRLRVMNEELRLEADWWAGKAPAYGFGRIEVAPIYSNAEAIRTYLTKQEWRFTHWPFEETKSIQWWRCSRNLIAGSARFSWLNGKAAASRQLLKCWAASQGCFSLNDLCRNLGKRWGYFYYSDLSRGRIAPEFLDQMIPPSPPPPPPPPPPVQTQASQSCSWLHGMSGGASTPLRAPWGQGQGTNPLPIDLRS